MPIIRHGVMNYITMGQGLGGGGGGGRRRRSKYLRVDLRCQNPLRKFTTRTVQNFKRKEKNFKLRIEMTIDKQINQCEFEKTCSLGPAATRLCVKSSLGWAGEGF